MYPFSIQHVCDKEKRSYTLYASSEEERENWGKALERAKASRNARQDANKVSNGQRMRSCNRILIVNFIPL